MGPNDKFRQRVKDARELLAKSPEKKGLVQEILDTAIVEYKDSKGLTQELAKELLISKVLDISIKGDFGAIVGDLIKAEDKAKLASKIGEVEKYLFRKIASILGLNITSPIFNSQIGLGENSSMTNFSLSSGHAFFAPVQTPTAPALPNPVSSASAFDAGLADLALKQQAQLVAMQKQIEQGVIFDNNMLIAQIQTNQHIQGTTQLQTSGLLTHQNAVANQMDVSNMQAQAMLQLMKTRNIATSAGLASLEEKAQLNKELNAEMAEASLKPSFN